MQIRWIQLLEFRNYRTLSYSPAPKLNILSGRNAQGKTNLLEGLAVLVTGRSFRTTRLADLPRWGAEAALVMGEIGRGEGTRTLRRAFRQIETGAWQPSGEQCEWARVIAFDWQDLAILNGAPAARRNFLDGFAGRLYASHIPGLLRYRKILARRAVLLQTGQADRLAPWDEQLAVVGVELLARRRAAAAALQTELARVFPALSGEAKKVEIRYRASLDVTEPAAFVAALERHRRAELRRGQTLVGPHRDDLLIELDGVDARVFGSRGQQRLLALALRLAEVLPVAEAAGTPPVLLLDDALSELDPHVQKNVLREIQTTEQVFLTTAEPEVPASDAARWEVKEGGLVAA
ncbi:MAG: DNA replication and repair protein RecF [Candidatus Rokubacteria bacterium]|nr:DNA replication and repair protein RecF [Candidatus Rokubacteria bacterium]